MRRLVLREILAIALILLCLEGGYRLYKMWRYGLVDYPDVLVVGYFQPDPRYGMVLTKSFSSASVSPKVRADPDLKRFFGAKYTTNSRGFRGPEVAVPKPAGTFRVVVLGESTSLGMEMDDDQTWPARLEALLQADPGFLKAHGAARVEVVNASNGAWRTREGLIRLKEEVGSLDPGMVLVAFNWTDGTQGTEGVDPERVNIVPKPWWRHSKVAENLWIRAGRLEASDVRHQEKLRQELRRDRTWARACERHLVEMQALCREIGAEMVLVDMPGLCRPGAAPDSEEFRAVVDRTRVTPANYPFWADMKVLMSGMFSDIGREQGVRVAGVSREFDTFTGPERVDLFVDEMHPNRRGAEKVALAVERSLTEPAL